MIKCLIGLCIIFSTFNVFANDPIKLSRWITYYYTHEKTEQIPIFIKEMDNPAFLSAVQNTLIGALPHLMLQEPQTVTVIFSDNTSTNIKDMAIEGLHRFGAAYLVPEKYKKPDTTYISLLDAKPFTPEELDMLWGAFMVTGKLAYVDAILTALEPQNHILTKQAARWSLFHHMQKHDKVKNRIEDYLDKQNPTYEAVKEVWDMYKNIKPEKQQAKG